MLLRRRQFLTLLACSGVAVAGTRFWPDQGWFNPCSHEPIDADPKTYDFLQSAWSDIDAARFRDCHVHLIGAGHGHAGAWINPEMRSLWHPFKRMQYMFYLDAACIDEGGELDIGYVDRLARLLSDFPPGAKAMLLAFDAHHDRHGRPVRAISPFFTSNSYTAEVVDRHPDRFDWIASVHPYREDALSALAGAIASGAKGIKWLPAAMGIDPASSRCDPFYEMLARHRLPLLTHAGSEFAVDAGEAQALGNPLLLRRPLDHGVRVIVAHCATLGRNIDLDRGKSGPVTANIELFARLMDDPRYERTLFGDTAAILQVNRSRQAMETPFLRTEWHPRLIHGSDYPLPGIMPIVSLKDLARRDYLSPTEVEILARIRRTNPLLFDFLLKRTVRVAGHRLSPTVFNQAHLFAGTQAPQTAL